MVTRPDMLPQHSSQRFLEPSMSCSVQKKLRTHILCPTLASQGWPRPALANFWPAWYKFGQPRLDKASVGQLWPAWARLGHPEGWPNPALANLGKFCHISFPSKNLSSSSSRGSSDSKHPGLRCSAFLAPPTGWHLWSNLDPRSIPNLVPNIWRRQALECIVVLINLGRLFGARVIRQHLR